MMGTVLHLESFDTCDTGVALRSKPHQKARTYEDGFAEGQSQAAAAFAAENESLREAVADSIESAGREYETIQAQVLRAVMPLLDSMLSALLPAMLEPALHAHLRDMVETALSDDLAKPLRLTVPVNQLEAIRGSLAQIHQGRIEIIADPALTDHAAWVSAQDQETALDLDGALALIAEHLQSLKELNKSAVEAS